VVEVLRQVTQVIVTTTTDKYKLHSPEVMHEPAMSDDDEEEEDGALYCCLHCLQHPRVWKYLSGYLW